MKEELIRIIEDNEEVTSPYIERINLELPFFQASVQKLETLRKMKKEDHLLYPDLNTGCTSLILHLLGLNPVNPLVFDLPFLLESEEDFSFYTNHSVAKKGKGLNLSPLNLLSELQIVCHYLQIDLDVITEKVVNESHIHYFVEAVIQQPELRARSFFLVDTTVDCFDQLENCRATSFDELVVFVYEVFIQQNPHAKSEAKIAEVYMDLLMVGWVWWLGCISRYTT